MNTVQDVKTGNDVDVSDMDGKELEEKLNNGVFSVDLVASLRDAEDNNIELHDFEAV